MVTHYTHSTENPKYVLDPAVETILTPHFDAIDPATYECDKRVKFDSKYFDEFTTGIFGESVSANTESALSSENIDQLTLFYESSILSLLGIEYVNGSAGTSAPWIKCESAECQDLIDAGDQCTDWHTLLNIPHSSNRKSAYLATVYASWALLLIQVLVVYIAFNAWPNYDEPESWESAVRNWGQMCGCEDKLEGAETEGGQQATKEIGGLLHILFGGIDLDPSDQFLGMFLVSERQRLRRYRHVLAALDKAGMEVAPRPKSWWSRVVLWIRAPGQKISDWLVSRPDVVLHSTLEGPDAPKLKLKKGGAGDGGGGLENGANETNDNNQGSTDIVMVDGSGSGSGNDVTTYSNEEDQEEGTPIAVALATPTSISTPNSKGSTVPSLPPSPFDLPTPTNSTTTTTALSGHHHHVPLPAVIEDASEHNGTVAATTTTASTTKTAKNLNSNSSSKKRRDWVYIPPSIAHSFVRLVSLRPSGTVPSATMSSVPSVTSASADATTASTTTLRQPASKGHLSNSKYDQVTHRYASIVETSSNSKISTNTTAGRWLSSWWGGGSSSSSTPNPMTAANTTKTPISTATTKKERKKLVVDARPHPLVTPVTLHSITTRLPITPYEVSGLYGMQNRKPVNTAELEEALNLSWFAKAAYGLQTVKWAYGSQSQGCAASTCDTLLDCALCSPLRAPLKFDAHFRKRNFSAILNLTGIDAGDLLYVSYTSAAFGVLPYMVMLHRPSKSVVVSVRGTVGFDDLITDLLSNPVDASASMPAWVKEELGSDAPMFAHAGILSSTNAVLRDLKAKGLLTAMLKTAGSGSGRTALELLENLDSEMFFGGSGSGDGDDGSSGGGTAITTNDDENDDSSPVMAPEEAAEVLEGGPKRRMETQRVLSRVQTLKDGDEMKLDLQRAQTMVGEAVGAKGWGVVITGHSLGAAVACMMSFQLRQYFPDLRCFAFCPPGGLVSTPLAHLAQRFCTSVVVGCDAISRVSFPNTQRVVDDMVLALARCKRPKLAILWDVISGRRKDPTTTPPTFCAFDAIGSEAKQALFQYVASSRLHEEGASADTRNLFPPGNIIHLRPFAAPGKKGKSVKNDVWDAVWVRGEDLIGEGLLLSLSMMRHHRVPTLQLALKSAIAQEAVLSSSSATGGTGGTGEGALKAVVVVED